MTTDNPAEATPRPWHAHEQPEIDRWGHRYWWLESESEHDIGDIGKEADAALIVAAVNDYDRLLRVEAAALDVYADRNLVVQAFGWAMEQAGYHVAWGVDEDEPDWPVLYIETPAGQVSWHIPKAERIYEPPDRVASFGPVKWDGHTNEQKADRLRAALDPTAAGEGR